MVNEAAVKLEGEKFVPSEKQQFIRKTLREQLADILRSKILRSEIAPGDRIVEEEVAKEYVNIDKLSDEDKKNKDKVVATVEDAIQGALDIIAEDISDNAKYRKEIKRICYREGQVVTRASKPEEKSNYEMYYEYQEAIKFIPSHRILAINRGEKEEFLKIKLEKPEEKILKYIEKDIIKNTTQFTEMLKTTIEDSFKRLIEPSVDREIRSDLTEKAEEKAIKVFGKNSKQLLLGAPIKGKTVMGFDPAYRTGCKIAIIDETGKLLDYTTVYPTEPQNDVVGARRELLKLIEKDKVDMIAIGNGTASRESEMFVSDMIKEVKHEVCYVIVSEAGASVYSASKLATEEYPDINVSIRGAISIARRLQDPLAELVKIDPKAIGVGQYQHDVDQSKLKKALDQTVENCVNLVGVNLNTASSHLLTYISGLGPQLAQNIVNYRAENGAFGSRKELMKVPRMGAKAFEQCAGFLRIPQAVNPLDNTAVHPESYCIVEQMAKDLKCSVAELIGNKELRTKINISAYVTSTVGMPTLQDIMQELEKPGRDPRQTIKAFEFDKNVRTIDDLREGMILPGIVGNITNFGAFVDIGIKENGLVHLSQLAERFISDPTEVVSIHQHVMVKILSVDYARKRIQLTMIGVEQN